MKLDRLMGIVLYLLNRDVVSAAVLAERFEVSRRTVQRDMEALCTAGVPIVSTYGKEGGYGIAEGFRLERSLVGTQDYANIVTALKGLCSAWGEAEANGTLEKVLAVSGPAVQSIHVDLSAAKEGISPERFRQLERAVREKKAVRMTYRSARGMESARLVEPLGLVYRWYAWYLVGYCGEREEYRTFKLVRIRSLEVLDRGFGRGHRAVEELLREEPGQERCLCILLRCAPQVREQVQEYLNGEVEQELGDGGFLYRLYLPDGERMWFSLLLGFGGDVEVLEPPELRSRIRSHAQEIAKRYPPAAEDEVREREDC